MDLRKYKRLKEATAPIFSMLSKSIKMNTFCLTKLHQEKEILILEALNVNDVILPEGTMIPLEDAL
jgi:hypothetical protein